MISRRHFIRTPPATAVLAGDAPQQKPNILFILADDLGWRDTGCQGSTFSETPNIDRLAARGLKPMQAYAPSPLCSPTRASILTGQHPARIGITWPACHEPIAQLEKKLGAGTPQTRVLNALIAGFLEETVAVVPKRNPEFKGPLAPSAKERAGYPIPEATRPDAAPWVGRQLREAVSDDGIRWRLLDFIPPDTDATACHVPQALVTRQDGKNWLYLLYATQTGHRHGDASYRCEYDRIRAMRREIE